MVFNIQTSHFCVRFRFPLKFFHVLIGECICAQRCDLAHQPNDRYLAQIYRKPSVPWSWSSQTPFGFPVRVLPSERLKNLWVPRVEARENHNRIALLPVLLRARDAPDSQLASSFASFCPLRHQLGAWRWCWCSCVHILASSPHHMRSMRATALPEFGTNLVRQHDRSMLGGWFGNHLLLLFARRPHGRQYFRPFRSRRRLQSALASHTRIILICWRTAVCVVMGISLLALFALSTKSDKPTIFSRSVDNFQSQTLANPIHELTFQALRLAAVTLSAVLQRLPRNRAPKGQRTSSRSAAPETTAAPHRGARPAAGHLRRLNRSWSVAFALDRDVAPARRAADENRPRILYEALADLGRFQLVNTVSTPAAFSRFNHSLTHRSQTAPRQDLRRAPGCAGLRICVILSTAGRLWQNVRRSSNT